MNIGQLRNVLKVAAAHYRDAGNEEAVEALSAFAANLLQGPNTSTVAAFVSRVEEARKATSAPAKPTRQRKR